MILLKVMPSRGEYFYRTVTTEAEAEELYTQYRARLGLEGSRRHGGSSAGVGDGGEDPWSLRP